MANIWRGEIHLVLESYRVVSFSPDYTKGTVEVKSITNYFFFQKIYFFLKKMSRATVTFGGGLDRVSVDLTGLSLAPRDYYSVSLINLVIPFSFPSDSSGLLLLSLETQPNVAIVNGICHRYSWCIPFD